MSRGQVTVSRCISGLLCLALIASLLPGPGPAQASTPERIHGSSLPTQGEELTGAGVFTLPSELPAGAEQYPETVTPLQTDVAGTIITDTVWTPAGSPYVLTDHVIVMAGVTLTVTAGVEVQGTADHGLKVDGQLVATGTASETISFTSQAGSGGGEWDGLSFRPGSSGTLAHAIVRHGGDWDGIAYSNVTAHGATLNLDHVQLLDSAASPASSHGLYVSGGAVVTMQNSDVGRHDGYGLYVADLGSSLTLVGNTIHDNTAAPLYLWPDQVAGSELGTNSFSGNGQPGVEIASDLLHVNSTWPRLVGSWYRLMGNVTVGENQTLTLEPGVVVRALDNEGLRVDGTLVARGTLTEPVTFTSDADSGGGQWDGLTFRPGSSGTLAHAIVRYAGDWDGLAYSAITVRGPATVVISQTQVLDSDAGTANANGLHVYGGAEVTVHDSVVGGHDGSGIYLAGSSLTLSGTTVQDNDGYGVYVGDAEAGLTLISNTIQNNGAAPLHLWPGQIPAANLAANSFVGNGQPGVEVEGGILDEDADWPALAGSWYRLMDNVTVGPGVTLRLAPDTVIKAIADRGLRVDGQLLAEGTPGQPILFTSDADSGAGQWDGLVFRPGSSGGLAHAIVRYAGNWDGVAYSGVSVRGAADLVIGQTQIMANSGSGLYVGADSRLRVEDSALTGNDGVGAFLAGGTVTLTRVTLSGNTGYGLQVENDARPVVLYSFVEDNGDAGIRVENSPVVVEDTSIAGNNGAGAFLSGGIITLTHSLVISNTSYGLRVENDARSVVLDSSIMENGDAGIRVENSTVTVETSGITGNANFGIQNTSPSPIVQAVDNWWGHPSGPYHPVANPDGLGEPVSDHVAFDPWLVVPAGSRQSVALVPGQPVTDTVNLLDYKDYHLITTAGLSLVVQVVPLGGSETLWVYGRRNDLPQWTRYDLRAQEKTARGVYELLVSPTQDGTYYFSVYGRDVSDTGGNYQIAVNVVERHLSDISPRSAGNGGEITLNLSGLGFVADMGVELRGVGLPTLTADNVTRESPTSIRAHFDLTGATVGVYDVYAIWPGGGEERLEAAFEVTPGIGPRLEVQLLAPDSVRRGRQYVLELEYSNTGDADMPPPLLRITAEGADLRLPGMDEFVGSSIQFFATNPGSPGGILPPGAAGHRSLIFKPTASGGNVNFSVSRLIPNESVVADNPISATIEQDSTHFAHASFKAHEGENVKSLSASLPTPDGLVGYTSGSTTPRDTSAKDIPFLIHNTRFVDAEGLSELQIQKVLDTLQGGLKAYQVEAQGRMYPAARILLNASFGRGYTVSPRVLLATLELASGLVTGPDTQPEQFDRALDVQSGAPQGLGNQLRWLSDRLGMAYLSYVTSLPDDQVANAASFAVRDVLTDLSASKPDGILAKGVAETFVQVYLEMYGVDPRQPLQVSQEEVAPFLHKPFVDQYQLATLHGAVNSFFDHEFPTYRNDPDLYVRLFTNDRVYDGEYDYGCTTLGVNCYDGHDGIDYNTGTHTITAAASGEILVACEEDIPGCPSEYSGLGTLVVITHTAGYRTVYGHLSEIGGPSPGETWEAGDPIEADQQVGMSGQTGNADGNHLHFEVWRNGVKVDPFGWWGDDRDPWETRSGERSTWLWQTTELTDDQSPSFEKFHHTGWYFVTDGYGDSPHAWYTFSQPTRQDWAVWALRVPAAGRYRVEAYWPDVPDDAPNWPAGSDRQLTKSAQYVVYNILEGQPDRASRRTVEVDQEKNHSRWYSLGEFEFGEGATALVMLSDQARDRNRAVVFDAVRLSGVIGPFLLYVDSQGQDQVDLHWTVNTVNNDKGFEIWRDDVQIGTKGPDVTTYTDRNLSCETLYKYYVRAVNSAGELGLSNRVYAITAGCPPDFFSEIPLLDKISRIIRPIDPNEKVGPEGVGSERAVTVSDELRYTVYFENLPAATAPAQEVVIEDRLDPDLDWTSLRFAGIAFGDKYIPATDGTYQLYTRQTVADYRESVDKEWWVDIAGEINPFTGQVEWTFRTLDPETGELPEDALAGFLPPNDDTGRGEGHVVFSIRPNSDRPDGTMLANKATIVFDTEASIVTNEVTNTLCVLVGDFDYNGRVDVADIMEVASKWRCRKGDDCYHEDYDLDKDDDIDIVDIMLVVVHWGESCE